MKNLLFLFLFISNTFISFTLKTNPQTHHSLSPKSEQQTNRVEAKVQNNPEEDSARLQQQSEYTHTFELGKKDNHRKNPSQNNGNEKKDSYNLKIVPKKGQFTLPIQINKKSYSFGLEHSSSIPSWIFTNQTKHHEVCIEDYQCEDSVPIECEDNLCLKSQEKPEKNDYVEAKSILWLAFSSNSQKINTTFYEAQKVYSQIEVNSIQGIFNIHNYNFSVLTSDSQTILQLGTEGEGREKIKISEGKQKKVSLVFNKNKKGKKFDFNNLECSFHSAQHLFSVPTQLYDELVSLISEYYLDNKCENRKHNLIKCNSEKKLVKTNYPLQFCFQEGCFSISLKSLVKEKKNNFYLLFDKTSQTNNFAFHPLFSQMYQIFVRNDGSVSSLSKQKGYQIPQKVEEEISQNSEKQDSEEEETKELDESEQQSYVEISHKHKKNTQTPPQPQKPYSRTLFVSILIYGFVAFLIIIVIKFKASESYAGRIIDRVVEAALYKLANSFFNRRRGYAVAEEEQKEEEIDYGENVKTGYDQKEGRDLFWQRKSAQGI